MGQNLALNIARKGFAISVFNRTTTVVTSFLEDHVRDGEPVFGAQSVEELVASLSRPRKVIVMVKAGPPVDQVIDQLTPLLEAG